MRQNIGTILITGILVTGIISSANADDVWKGGSLYSHFGLGLPYDYRSTYADGMGVNGVAMHSNRLPSIANPAAWSRTTNTNVGGVFEINSFDAQIGENQAASTRYQAGPLQMVLPIIRDRIGVSFSISPLTASRFTSANEKQLPAEENNSGSEMHYGIKNVGSGGINKIETGIGVRITNTLSVGYAPSLLLGVIERDMAVEFDNPDYRSVNLRESTSHYGFGNRLGIYYYRRDAIRRNDRVAFGAAVSLPVNLVSERELSSLVDLRDVTVHPPSYYGDGQATFPLEASGGISYNLNSYFQVSADMLYQNWDDYINFRGESESFLKDRMKFGLGSRYIASQNDGNSFYSRLDYRLGVSYDTGSLKLENTHIETLTLHVGLGIPSRTNSSVNLNAEYGFRGTDSNNLISERVFAIKISFNLSELMFIQRRLQ